MKAPIKVGDKLIAIDPCRMLHSGEEALIVGKAYPVKAVNYSSIRIASELDSDHIFRHTDIDGFFKRAEQ